ncbi:formate/nitrite transporter family protein [Sodalis sp. RH21]|uniref:formate/nitrite transporter family protein n=1 Tax=unclassified Sodalis (in: enterobacteria) TaxID=2636512 RepID=UPI0039B44858
MSDTSGKRRQDADKRNDSEVVVDSEEHDANEKIEVKEENLPSPAAAIHEQIREEGEKELERDGQALFWSAVAAGLSMGASLMAKGILHARLPEGAAGFFIENLGYTFGFIIVIMAKQQLFTENTLTAVLPIMHKPSRHNFIILLRLWLVVLAGNLAGTAAVAFGFLHMPIFNGQTREAFVSISQAIMANPPADMFANGIIAGWIIASMVWMLPQAGNAKLLVIALMTYLVGIGDLTHIVVGSVEIFYLVFNGSIPWYEFFYPFAIPTLAGNIVGGTFIFALLSHAQIRNDLSSQRKQDAKKQGKAGKSQDDQAPRDGNESAGEDTKEA